METKISALGNLAFVGSSYRLRRVYTPGFLIVHIVPITERIVRTQRICHAAGLAERLAPCIVPVLYRRVLALSINGRMEDARKDPKRPGLPQKPRPGMHLVGKVRSIQRSDVVVLLAFTFLLRNRRTEWRWYPQRGWWRPPASLITKTRVGSLSGPNPVFCEDILLCATERVRINPACQRNESCLSRRRQ